MKKSQSENKLRLSKDTIRNLVPSDLEKVGGGKISCGETGCDCSGGGDTVDMCHTLIPR